MRSDSAKIPLADIRDRDLVRRDETVKDHLLIRAARGEAVERVPVWAMRQAGRWDPEFNRIRSGLDFYAFSENVELSTAATLAPRRFGVDAIILFYDITTLTIAMGLPFRLMPDVGPVPEKPVRTKADVDKLHGRPDPAAYRHVLELAAAVKKELSGELPVLAFAGAPFTLASYCLGFGKDLSLVRIFAREHPDVFAMLLERLTYATIDFLKEMIRAGADAWQLFDSWAGKLSEDEYDRWAQRAHKVIFSAVTETPRILFVKNCPYLTAMATTGADVVSLGTRHDLAAARSEYPHLVFQGNVDDQLLRTGTPDDVIHSTLACLKAGGGRNHIINLAHGMNRDAKVENFAAFVATARGAGRK
ncbi:MAG: uroporphyrinogen decarboxylase [Gemmataceae bacterium]|nr:uroporphyrinogen decarboxylase [Gemmataceae bacterium]